MDDQSIPEGLLDFLRCVNDQCGGPVDRAGDHSEVLTCIRCGTDYQLLSGIPVMFPDQHDTAISGSAEPTILNGNWSLNRDLSEQIVLHSGSQTIPIDFRTAKVKIVVDSSIEKLQALRKADPGIWPIAAIPTTLPVRDCSIDIALNSSFAGPHNNGALQYRELARITKPAGTVIAIGGSSGASNADLSKWAQASHITTDQNPNSLSGLPRDQSVILAGGLQTPRPKPSLLNRVIARASSRRQIRKVADATRSLSPHGSKSVDDLSHFNYAIEWLKRAQDSTPDGGVSRGVRITSTGISWSPSYPETTGYIIPSLINAAKLTDAPEITRRAQRMGDWLQAIQLESGAWQGGNIKVPEHPTYFDTGQILRGMSALSELANEPQHRESADRGYRYLLDNYSPSLPSDAPSSQFSQRPWASYAVAPAVAFGMQNEALAESALELSKRAAADLQHTQNSVGWFYNCSLDKNTDAALLHTVAYAMDGLWDIAVAVEDPQAESAAQQTLDGVIFAMDHNGYIPGRLTSEWKPAVNWACLTGTAQTGVLALKVYQRHGDEKYLDAARLMADYLKTRQYLGDNQMLHGAMWGSWPIDGGYETNGTPNWATKYFVDLLLLLQSSRPN